MKQFLKEYEVELTVIMIVGLLIALFFLYGCGPKVILPQTVKPPSITEVLGDHSTAEHVQVESAEQKVERLEGDLQEAKTKLEHARQNESEARLAGVRTLITWLTAICVLVGILSVGAFVFLRIKSLLLVTAACGAMVVAARATSSLLDHPIITGISLAAIIGSVVAAIWWKQSHTALGLTAAVQFGEDAIKAITPEAVELTKIKHAALQEASGVKSIIDDVLAKVRSP